MALPQRKPRSEPIGRDRPRLAPPTPARSLLSDYLKTCEEMEIELFPWQKVAARYEFAVGADGRWLYPEVAEVVSRQNGKTRPLVPFIVHRLRIGRRIMHTAQNRELPREVFGEVADYLGAQPGELAVKGGRIQMPRFANGQEEIRMKNGGHYRIVAPTRSGARGPSNDDLIIDEARELDDFEFIAAARPTLMASKNPQTIYKSNAGEEDSVVLNGLEARAASDPSLAYLSWSASPERAADDIAGWLESNPSIGHLPGLLENLQRDFRSHSLQGTMAIFETENLCRRVITTRERLVDDADWLACRGPLGKPLRPAFAVALDPDAKRASVAMAWRVGDVIALTMVIDRQGDVDVDALRDEVATLARRLAADVGYDPLQDTDLVRTVVKGKAKPINGAKFATASARFAQRVASHAIRWADADPVTDDLTWTARKPDGEQGSFHAVRAKDDRPITASLAAVRAVWLASDETPRPPRIR